MLLGHEMILLSDYIFLFYAVVPVSRKSHMARGCPIGCTGLILAVKGWLEEGSDRKNVSSTCWTHSCQDP